MILDGAKSVAHDDGHHSSARHAKVGQWLGVAAAFVLATAGAMFHEHDHADASPAAVMTSGNGDYISIDDSSTLNINAVQEGESFNARFERFQVTVTLDAQQVPA